MRKKLLAYLLIAFVLLSTLYGCRAAHPPKILIAIDPGHGGPLDRDKGYKTLDGTYECIINRAVALYLEEELIKRGYDVIFTKDPDIEVHKQLEYRSYYANEKNADLFISIHHDSNGDKKASGFWVFYSSYKVHIDSDGIIVVYNGNEYDLVSEENLPDYTIKTVTDGTKTFTINSSESLYKVIDTTPCDAAIESKKLAHKVFASMEKLSHIKPRGSADRYVVDEEYRVLRCADMPSILIEAGFMSNPKDSQSIMIDVNQKALAIAIADGIDAYYAEKN